MRWEVLTRIEPSVFSGIATISRNTNHNPCRILVINCPISNLLVIEFMSIDTKSHTI